MVFTLEKIERQINSLKKAACREVIPLTDWKFREGDLPGAQAAAFDDRDWADFKVGGTWGGYDVTGWFRRKVAVPERLRDKRLVLRLQPGPRDGGDSTAEALLYVNGRPLQAFDVWHEEAWLPPEALESPEMVLALKAWSGVIGVPEKRCFRRAELAWVDEATDRYARLCDILVNGAKTLGKNDLRRSQLVQALDDSYARIDFFQPGSEAFYRSMGDALDCLLDQLTRWQGIAEIKPTITAVGHAHIDMAWLWRLKDTREKAARTFTTVLHLMRQYPEYVFLHSSPQLYKFLKQDYPEIYAQIKQRIAEGRWEINGGTWVETDTNLVSGESLIRQFLYGKRFAREEFGLDMQTLWLPDVFGYSWALPQIMKKSGIRTFLTSKISWNQTNRFPYDTFLWRGIDGSEILTYFVTTPDVESNRYYSYNATLAPDNIQKTWENYQQKDLNDELLSLFGWGDGGGGPTREMLDSAHALANIPGLPRVQAGRADDFFDRLEKKASAKRLPVWDGELYLEYHRGTYTSQAQVKRANRQAEILFNTAEALNASADVLLGQDNYPVEDLRQGWESILLHQFHDILPGSSIHPVYEDARRAYEQIHQTGMDALDRAISRLVSEIHLESEGLVVFNTLGWDRTGMLEVAWSEELDGKALASTDGTISLPQEIHVDGERRLLFYVEGIPAFGHRVYQLVPGPLPGYLGRVSNPFEIGVRVELARESRVDRIGGLVVTPERLENDFYLLELNKQGQLVRLLDKRAGREVLPAGERANVLQAFEDRPMDFDAWDIDPYYTEKMREVGELLEAEVEECGPLRGTLRLRWRFLSSEIIQRLTIYANSPRIDFRTEVDWHEHQVLLKAAFPVQIRSTLAAYEIQFGAITRPTHANTSWDEARFEVPAQRWADLSEGDYGVSLLNDCKYGYDIHDHTLRLTLIKSGIMPDPQADQGKHVFTYSLLPHPGDSHNPEILREAGDLNTPMLARFASENLEGSLPASASMVRSDQDHIIVNTIKKAEDEDGWVVRIYESQQRRGTGQLEFGKPILRAAECDLMEEEIGQVEVEANRLSFPIDPYEIKTFRVWFA